MSSPVEWLLGEMSSRRDAEALVTHDETLTYGQLLDRVEWWQVSFRRLKPGSVISIEGDYGLESIAAFLAATAAGHISIPMAPDSGASHPFYLDTAAVEYRIRLSDSSESLQPTGRHCDHALVERLRASGHPGLVLFSSGSTGQPKAALHDLNRLLEKFRTPRQRLRTLVFLLLDHIGGINTLFYTLANGGTVVLARGRSAAAVCEAIATHRVELLPTSPTFLNLLLLSGEADSWDLSSLKLITYGTEPMPASTLERACKRFPGAKFLQTYGLTELGILRSESRDSSSLWMRIGGEGFHWRIVDGRLWIRAEAAMLGYLNAPTPFDADGYFDTGDIVERDGEWVRIHGRDGDIINVGGNKVHPAEVESVLLEMDGVVDVSVSGEPHPLTGRIVTATVRLERDETLADFKLRMRKFCTGRLGQHMMPAKVTITDQEIHSSRFKRIRRSDPTAKLS